MYISFSFATLSTSHSVLEPFCWLNSTNSIKPAKRNNTTSIPFCSSPYHGFKSTFLLPPQHSPSILDLYKRTSKDQKSISAPESPFLFFFLKFNQLQLKAILLLHPSTAYTYIPRSSNWSLFLVPTYLQSRRYVTQFPQLPREPALVKQWIAEAAPISDEIEGERARVVKWILFSIKTGGWWRGRLQDDYLPKGEGKF